MKNDTTQAQAIRNRIEKLNDDLNKQINEQQDPFNQAYGKIDVLPDFEPLTGIKRSLITQIKDCFRN